MRVALQTSPNQPNRYLIHCRMKAKALVREDVDYWTMHTGKPRVGKSTESFWNALYTDPNFGKDFLYAIEHKEPTRIVWDAESFLSSIESGKPGQSIVLDEAGEVWFYVEWATEVQRAIAKASQQIGERNLDVHLLAPKPKYIGPVGRARCDYWVYVYRMGGQRGFMELAEASESKWDKRLGPFWETTLHHRFLDLPPKYREPYRKLKREAGAERLAKYIQDVHRADVGMPTLKEQSESLMKRLTLKSIESRDRLRNSKGTFDPVLIQAEFNVGSRVARAVAMKSTRRWGQKRRVA